MKETNTVDPAFARSAAGCEVGAAQRDAIFGGDFNKVGQHDRSFSKVQRGVHYAQMDLARVFLTTGPGAAEIV